MPWIALAVAGDFFFDIDLLLLSGHMSREELAIFGVCTRVFSLVSFGVGAVYAVTMPDMFESEAMKDRAGFHRKIGEANLVASGLSVALLLIVLVGVAARVHAVWIGVPGRRRAAGYPLRRACHPFGVRTRLGGAVGAQPALYQPAGSRRLDGLAGRSPIWRWCRRSGCSARRSRR